MKDFAGKIAVITGGGTGMGRELARQLVAEGCNVAMCDVSPEAMAETKRLCESEKLPQGLRVTTHVADVSIEDHLKRFRDELVEQQETDRIHLLLLDQLVAKALEVILDRDVGDVGGDAQALRQLLALAQPFCFGHGFRRDVAHG